MSTFYFNTGVKPPSVMYGKQVWKGGTKQIPFECDVPEDYRFMFACDNPDLPEGNSEYWEVAKIKPEEGGMLSEYAYFMKPVRV